MKIDLLKLLGNEFNSHKKISNTNSDIMSEIGALSPILSAHLEKSDIKKTTNWLIYKDIWLQNEAGSFKSKIYRGYDKGDVILQVNYGTSNIGTEIRYPHPGVVIYDQGEDWVIVAPITAARLDADGKPYKMNDFEVIARKDSKPPKDSNQYSFKKHSVIQLDQLRRVSKHRISIKGRKKLRDNLKREIENVLYKKLHPEKQEKFNEIVAILQEKNKELDAAKKEIEQLKSLLGRG